MTVQPGGPPPRALGVLAAGLAVQVALYIAWSAVPWVGAFAQSPVGVLMWWLSVWLGPVANAVLSRRWIREGGGLGPLGVGLWTVRACATGTAAWVVAVVPLFVLAIVLL
ncbi:hypothetical protein [Streptomyces sp. NRRL B-24484]|uniref:hypothetical protein n=1 Tax=Streptomyces sp. NRRL B-24484 TaxID=1463833 RepID=UPI0004BF23C4|nr:hypothetical protein [Streptomyces sp. NRRL B-24484]